MASADSEKLNRILIQVKLRRLEGDERKNNSDWKDDDIIEEFCEKLPSDANLGYLKAAINRHHGQDKVALFHQGDIVEELDDKDKEYIKVTDLFEAEEHDPFRYDFDCYPKNADGVSCKRKKKIDIRNATTYHLIAVVGYKINEKLVEKTYDLPPHNEQLIDTNKNDGIMVDIKLFKYDILRGLRGLSGTLPVNKFTMAVHDHYIISAKGNVFNAEPRMRFRRWKTKQNGIDLDPHKGLKRNTNACRACHF